MRPRFEKDLRLYSELAKDEFELIAAPNNEDLNKDWNDFTGALNWRLKNAAENQATDQETQLDVYGFQREKQQSMRELRAELKCLDDPECELRERQPEERSVRYEPRLEGFVYQDEEGRERSATFGELVTDLDWGRVYHMDKANIPRTLIKKYLVERTKHDLSAKLDQQIILSEGGSADVHVWKREAYQRIAQEQASGEIWERAGFICEKMVKNFLKKLSMDYALPFTLREADVYQDVEQKIDFIIHREDYVRGVGVETTKEDVGIQFSINRFATEKKQRQVAKAKQNLGQQERIRDIVLVIFPEVLSEDLVGQWDKAGRPAGGPDKGLKREVAQELFERLLGGVFSDEEITAQWERVRDNFKG